MKACILHGADERNGNYTLVMNEIKGSTGHVFPSLMVDNTDLYVVWEDDRFITWFNCRVT